MDATPGLDTLGAGLRGTATLPHLLQPGLHRAAAHLGLVDCTAEHRAAKLDFTRYIAKALIEPVKNKISHDL